MSSFTYDDCMCILNAIWSQRYKGCCNCLVSENCVYVTLMTFASGRGLAFCMSTCVTQSRQVLQAAKYQCNTGSPIQQNCQQHETGSGSCMFTEGLCHLLAGMHSHRMMSRLSGCSVTNLIGFSDFAGLVGKGQQLLSCALGLLPFCKCNLPLHLKPRHSLGVKVRKHSGDVI